MLLEEVTLQARKSYPLYYFLRCFYKATEISVKGGKGGYAKPLEWTTALIALRQMLKTYIQKGNLREVRFSQWFEDLALTLQGGITGVSSQSAYR